MDAVALANYIAQLVKRAQAGQHTGQHVSARLCGWVAVEWSVCGDVACRPADKRPACKPPSRLGHVCGRTPRLYGVALTASVGLLRDAWGLYGISTLCSQVLSAAARTLRTNCLLVLQEL